MITKMGVCIAADRIEEPGRRHSMDVHPVFSRTAHGAARRFSTPLSTFAPLPTINRVRRSQIGELFEPNVNFKQDRENLHLPQIGFVL